MSSRLRRMLLVNARTSGKFTSGSINEVDPRDGAAVTGDNAVGKTTTLELVPLFFGNLPSQIVESGGGREPMLRFVLPYAQSAIVFEYQRGPSEQHDVRFVVLRRQDNSDAPEYRFFRGPFRDDVFIVASPDGQQAFMGDVASVEAARRLGLEFERKLSSSDYRAVILGHKANNISEAKLRQISLHYSYSTKSLPNLDRLVAAVVKEKVDFRDFVNVAVTMVQDTIGGPVTVGMDRNNRFSLRQSKNQISRWLADRDACASAFKQEPQVEAMRQTLTDHSHQKRQLSEMLADIRALKRARADEKTRATGTMEEIKAFRAKAEPIEKETSRLLEKANQDASDAATSATRALTTDKAQHDYFMDEEAEVWETSVNSLQGLQGESKQLRQQIEIAQGQSGDIAKAYNEQISQAQRDASEEKVRLEQFKADPNQRHADDTKMLGDEERQSIAQFDELTRLQLEKFTGEQSTMSEALGKARTLAVSPQASLEAMEAVESALKRRSDHQETMSQAQGEFSTAQGQAYEAKTAFRSAEEKHKAAQAAQDKAGKALNKARLTLAPPGGTLLSVLRAAPGTEWKSTLARVLDPALLQRDDLSPLHIPGDAQVDAIYGWVLDTGQIVAPMWTNDDDLRQEVSFCQDALRLADTAAASANDDLKKSSQQLEESSKTLKLAESKVVVLKGKVQGIKDIYQIGIDKRNRQEKDAAELARQQVASIENNIITLKSQITNFQKEKQRQRGEIQSDFEHKRDDADTRRRQAINQIDNQISACEQQVKQRAAALQEQCEMHLREAGVNVESLKLLQNEANDLETKVAKLDGKRPMIEQWKKWLSAGGRTRLEGLQRLASAALSAHEAASRTENDNKTSLRQALERYEAETARLSKRLIALDEDAAELQSLEESLGAYQPQHPSTIDPNTTVSELRSRMQEQRQALAQLEERVYRDFKKLREVLTGSANSVRDLVEMTLSEVQGKDILRQADELSLVYRRIGREIVPNVNNEVKSILENVRQFRKRITDFETEVVRFNNKLQSGLDSVSMFERLRDFKISVVTDFSTLGFMKKLESLDDVIRDQQLRVIGDIARDLPSEKTAAALRDFMSVIGQDGGLEVDLSKHITLSGSVTVNGVVKQFKRASDLEHISSHGLNAIILITLLSGMLNMIRGSEPIYIPWVTDEVGKFDPQNFHTLMKMLKDNRIDVVTASPKLTIAEFRHFARCYRFGDLGSIARYAIPGKRRALAPTPETVEV